MAKKLNINEIIEILDNDNLMIHISSEAEMDDVKKNIILVSHELTRSGAPTVLLEMAKVMRDKGNSVWVLCKFEGMLMESFISAGINVIIYSNYMKDTIWLRKARKCFDLWCVNTLVLADLFIYLNKMNVNVIWWVHEWEVWFEKLQGLLHSIEIGINSRIFAAGPYVQSLFKKYMNKDVEILNFMVEDSGISKKKREQCQKVRFLQAGTIDSNKRQGLFAEAIELLSDEVREAAEFVICGNRENANLLELAKIDRVTEKYSNVRLIPQMDRESLYKMYDEVDAVVVASDIETTSAIMVEAMMKGKFGICSDTCGITHYIEDGKEGYIFRSGRADELAEKITYVVNNINSLQHVGVEARKVYEKVYSEEIFSKQINEILEWAEENKYLLEEMPLTSIIVVTFNKGQGLLYTLRSIYSQTYTSFEVIVVDDASVDNTVGLIEDEFGAKENLKYIVNEEHLGKGECFNIGLECCEGEYIAFAEAGDMWVDDKIENQLEAIIINKGYDGIYTYAQVIQNDGKKAVYPSIAGGSGQLSNNIQHLMLKGLDKVCIATILLKRSVFERIGLFRDDLDGNAPYEFLFREISKLSMLGMAELTVFSENPPIMEDNLEDFICANCLILINQVDDIVASGYKEEFFASVLMSMERLGVKDYFIEIFKENANDILMIYGEQKRINSNMRACSGCGACASVCPTVAIKMEMNEEGFLYPVIDHKKCVNCNRCVNVCAVNYNKPIQNYKQEVYAVRRIDEMKRMESQSGGAFATLAEAILNINGVVYGVGFDWDLEVCYLRVDAEKELYKLKGSKYVQAKVGNIFELVLQDLQAGRFVLFAGTACHVDGLKHFIGDRGAQLFTCDLVCHGVPSPMIYRDYLDYVGKKNKSMVEEFNFRDKSLKGWHVHEETWIDNGGNKFASRDYTQLFYTHLGFRESCYVCKYASMHRVSDVTIGDFWGIEKVYPDMDDGKGVSLMLINSQKGKELFEMIKENVEYREATAIQCRQHNLVAPSNRPKEREAFWKDYKEKDFRYILRAYANEYYAVAANNIVLSNWEKVLQEGKDIPVWLQERGISKIALCGNTDINKLLISDMKRARIQVTAEVDVYENSVHVLGVINERREMKQFIEKEFSDTDVVVVTDEAHSVDIIERLYRTGIPLERIVPLSFIVTQEV